MRFDLNVFGATCKACDKPLIKQEFIYGKFYMKIDSDGYVNKDSGYFELYHSGCAP